MSKLSVFAVILLSTLPLLNGKVASAVNLVVEKPIENPLAVTEKKGLTFVKEDHLVQFGIDLVGCRNWSDPDGMDCNAYTGDTPCSEFLPVLCAKIDYTHRPAYLIYGNGAAMPAYFYVGWNRGHIATTLPVAGSQFSNRAAVDAFCADSFGTGWRVAEFHDGFYIPAMNGTTFAGNRWTKNAGRQGSGGWHFYSYGDVRNDIRFWVHINDQPSTCWTQ